ncbi:transcription factor Maf-like [Hypomesus transpacificus]|uniref:transcription factor Maf-like n=1 Tax=Hypomesus transpacificus TaxID=137520 RepID=UPI001F087D1F|nr:transcription factor Maf-like [Hypomesus transpacificus]
MACSRHTQPGTATSPRRGACKDTSAAAPGQLPVGGSGSGGAGGPAGYGGHGGHGHGGPLVERGGLGSVLRDLVKPGDENLREMNKKLQNMLEEQLTKNMHLQKDLEVLSQEIVRLSKEISPGPAAQASG